MEEKNIKQKENQLKKQERLTIKKKSKYIMIHSKEILENIDKKDKTFLNSLLLYLLSNDNSTEEIGLFLNSENLYDYIDSMKVIFEICYLLPQLGYSETDCINFRNKLRLYTKHFSPQKTEDLIEGRQLVKMNTEKIIAINASDKEKRN